MHHSMLPLVVCLLAATTSCVSAATAFAGFYDGRAAIIDSSMDKPDPYCTDKANGQELALCAFGFGSGAMGGLGGKYYTVTNANDSGPGSLRDVLAATRGLRRWIRFTKGAQFDIYLKNEIVLWPEDSYTTIDGRGANVTFYGYGILGGFRQASTTTAQVGVTHVIMHNLRFTSSADRTDLGGMNFARNIWYSHCTFSNPHLKQYQFGPYELQDPETKDGPDGALDLTRGCTDVTISQNYFTSHHKLMLMGHTDLSNFGEIDEDIRMTFALNKFGPNVVTRAPRGRFGKFDMFNNLYEKFIYNPITGSSNPVMWVRSNIFIGNDPANFNKIGNRGNTTVNGVFYAFGCTGGGGGCINEFAIRSMSVHDDGKNSMKNGMVWNPQDVNKYNNTAKTTLKICKSPVFPPRLIDFVSLPGSDEISSAHMDGGWFNCTRPAFRIPYHNVVRNPDDTLETTIRSTAGQIPFGGIWPEN